MKNFFAPLWIIFIISIFIIPRFSFQPDFVNRYAYFVSGLLMIMMGLDGVFHPTEVIESVRSKRPVVFDKLFPKPGDENLVVLLHVAMIFFALTIVILGGLLGWLV